LTMSWILGIDTSSVDLGIGLYCDTAPIASYSRFIRNSHAEHIAQIVEMLLSVNNVTGKDIDRVAVSVGPGSFTGLRIGISFAKGFCFGRNSYILPVSSLEILAHTAHNYNGRIVAVIDARNNDVFYGVFDSLNGNISRVLDDTVGTFDDFKGLISKDDIIVTDTMGYTRSTVFTYLKEYPHVLPVEQFHVQRGLFCAAVGAKVLNSPELWQQDTTTIVPNYLRSSSAQKPLKVPA
jgi:tRNA threonylcarbamoyladenosine biosynthesis protein TsaB